jgi:hypothetical protein
VITPIITERLAQKGLAPVALILLLMPTRLSDSGSSASASSAIEPPIRNDRLGRSLKRRSSRQAIDIVRPSLHHHPSLINEFGAIIGTGHFIFLDVRKLSIDNLVPIP